MRRGEQSIFTFPLPEVREMIAAAVRYVRGETHYSSLVGPTENCAWWGRVYGVHPEIRRLAADWQAWVDQTWNEWGATRADAARGRAPSPDRGRPRRRRVARPAT